MAKKLISAGMNVARLNFSHGTHDDHRESYKELRAAASELGVPLAIMQDLQGPKIRVGQIPEEGIELVQGKTVVLVPEKEYNSEPGTFPVDYPYISEEAKPGMQVLLADGLFELQVAEIKGHRVICTVIEGGVLKSRKGVNFPNLNLRLPSLTEKDIRDLAFGLEQNVDWISLSFVRSADDIRILKNHIEKSGKVKPVIAKIEKPQAIDHLEAIVDEVAGIMVARGDLGVEMSPEKVPMLQKRIIELCNRKGKPVITATQMLESMIVDPRPTRAETSDVANAIIDGTDCIMLSGETAMGNFPVKSVEMMVKIALDVESKIEFKTYPPSGTSDMIALSMAANGMEKVLRLDAIADFTNSGRSAMNVVAERPNAPVCAMTTHPQVYHALNMLWGVIPILISDHPDTFEQFISVAEYTLKQKNIIESGDAVLILGGIPPHVPGGTNFIKIHKVQ